MKSRKLQLKVPYRQQDLKTVREFIDYCKEYGIDTDEEELEFYEKEELLLPAIRVLLGYVPLRNIFMEHNGGYEWRVVEERLLNTVAYKELDPIVYYTTGSLIRFSFDPKTGEVAHDNWLGEYAKDNGGILNPAEQKFKLWKDYPSGGWMVKDKDQFEDNYEALYTPLQIYPLQFIRTHYRVTIKNAALAGSDEQWIKRGKNLHEMFFDEIKDTFVRKRVVEQLRLIGILNDIKDLIGNTNKKLYEYYRSSVADLGGDKQAVKKDLDAKTHEVKTQLAEPAKKILDKHGFSAEELEDAKLTILELGTFGLGSHAKKLRREYLKKLDDQDLIDAEDPYKNISFINFFLEIVGKPQVPITEQILRSKARYCKICRSPFLPKKKTQILCLSPECEAKKAEYYAEHKQKKRAADPTYGNVKKRMENKRKSTG